MGKALAWLISDTTNQMVITNSYNCLLLKLSGANVQRILFFLRLILYSTG
jgi:hypothetical protein